jgi:hypothetical protein
MVPDPRLYDVELRYDTLTVRTLFTYVHKNYDCPREAVFLEGKDFSPEKE